MEDIFARKGILKISGYLLKNEPYKIMKILNQEVLVVGVDIDYMTDIITYKCYSKHFDLIENGEIIPNYLAAVDKKQNVNFKRTED